MLVDKFSLLTEIKRKKVETMSPLTEILLDIFAIVTPLIGGYIAYILRKQSKEKTAMGQAVLSLLQAQMLDYFSKCKQRGYVTKHGFETFDKMYSAYKSLGGNGLIDKVYEELKAMSLERNSADRIDSFDCW